MNLSTTHSSIFTKESGRFIDRKSFGGVYPVLSAFRIKTNRLLLQARGTWPCARIALAILVRGSMTATQPFVERSVIYDQVLEIYMDRKTVDRKTSLYIWLYQGLQYLLPVSVPLVFQGDSFDWPFNRLSLPHVCWFPPHHLYSPGNESEWDKQFC